MLPINTESFLSVDRMIDYSQTYIQTRSKYHIYIQYTILYFYVVLNLIIPCSDIKTKLKHPEKNG